MFFVFSVICRVLDYTVVQKSKPLSSFQTHSKPFKDFYWILGSVFIEAFLTSMIWMDSFGVYCFEIKNEFYKKHQPNQYSEPPKPKDSRIRFYLAALVVISKVNN